MYTAATSEISPGTETIRFGGGWNGGPAHEEPAPRSTEVLRLHDGAAPGDGSPPSADSPRITLRGLRPSKAFFAGQPIEVPVLVRRQPSEVHARACVCVAGGQP